MKKKPIFRYEIGIQVNEVWHYLVDAENLKDAEKKIRRGDAEQICSTSGGVHNRKSKIFRKEKIK